MMKTIFKRFSLTAAGFLLMSGTISSATVNERIPSHAGKKNVAAVNKSNRIKDPVASLMAPRLKNNSGDFRTFPSTLSPSFLNPSKAIGTQLRVASAEAGRIYGGAIYADNWVEGYQPVGVYSFEINDGTTLSPEAVGDDYVVTGGGVYANGEYHFVSYMSFMGMVLANLYTCNIEDWEITRALPVQAGSIAQDMAYDVTTGNVYGCFMNDDADGWVMGVLDLESGQRRKLADLDLIIITVAVNSQGEVYGIGIDGNLYQFDKETGTRTLIGHTGHQPMYSASGCFDLTDDTFYWECIEADSKGNIYTVDTKTGATEYVTTVTNNMELTGMFIPVAEAPDAAPEAVKELAMDFNGAALEGNIVFTLPEIRFDGKGNVEGPLSYVVSVNEEEQYTGSGEPGQLVAAPISVESPGFYRISVVVSNEYGFSPIKMSQFWIGNDMPESPSSAKLVKGDVEGEMILSWDAPDKTVHGGYVDSSAITYDVVRMPDGIKVADHISETTLNDSVEAMGELKSYWFEITPWYNGYAAETFFSNHIGVGVAQIPFYNAIDTEDDFALFNVIDANEDGETWGFDETWGAARIKYSMANNFTEPMDDWLMTPAFCLVPGRLYRFNMRVRSYYSYLPERVEVKMGSVPNVSGMTIDVVAPTIVAGDETPVLEGYVHVENEGLYYFGIHACSSPDTMFLYADEISVEEGPLLGTPAAVTGLTAMAAEHGELEVTLSFTLPTNDVLGDPIDELEEVIIYIDGHKSGSVAAGAPGSKMTYVDKNAKNGINTYSVVCTNDKGEGLDAKTSVYVGHDRPGMPVNVKATLSGNDVILTWDAPESGETGGYYDPSALTYTVLRANDEKELAVGITDLTFTDVNPPLNGFRQEFYGYYIYAQSPAGYGYGQLSNIVAVGTPFDMPFVETFADGKIMNDPWDVQKPEYVEGNWTLKLEGQYPDVQSQDPDGGLVSFIPESAEDFATLTSGMIDFTNAESPVAEFWWYDTESAYDLITLYIIPEGGEAVKVATAALSVLTDGPCWRKTSADLSQFIGCKYIQLAFEAKSSYGYTNIHIDNIRVKNRYNDNISIGTLTAPETMRAFTDYNVKVNVENSGVNVSGEFTVNLLRNGEVIASRVLSALQPDAVETMVFTVQPDIKWSEEVQLSAIVDYTADQFSSDNESNVVTVIIQQPKLPYVDTLTGTLTEDGDVVLEWDEPVMPDVTGEPETDDVESYPAFSIRGIGDWITLDVDKQTTYGISNNTGGMLGYPNAGAPMAFMVFNPSAAGIDVEDGAGEPTSWAPHSGDQMFASFAAENGANDDWLISPMLPGVAQTVSFYVKSLTSQYGFEKYEVYYSTSGTAIEDFVMIGDLRSAPVVWDEVSVDLPEGARYFAIRCVSNDCYIFLVDDLTFISASNYPEELSLVGYNIYRDGELLNIDEPVADPIYTDEQVPDGEHVYTVTAVYDKGESRMSQEVAVSVAGITMVNSGYSVMAGSGLIVIEGAEGIDVSIVDSAGRVIDSKTASAEECFVVAPGVYVVKLKGCSVKVMVK